MNRRNFFLTGSGLALASLLPTASMAARWYLDGAYAVGGFDPVAYFTQGRPVQGSQEIQSNYEGATFLFSSVEHQAAFNANPAEFAPQYGGYCAFAVANGSLASGSPQAWTVSDNKLYLNVNKVIRTRWNWNRDAFIEQGDANWPSLRV